MDTQRLNDEGRDLWNQKAAFWDTLYGDEGNAFHRLLISPSVEKLLALQPNERVLDIACGNGALARRLAALGGVVVAVDFSQALLEKARQRGQHSGVPIQYVECDATNEEALAALGERAFDAVVCTMALMDMPSISPLYRAARRLLRPQGRLVIATAHPAFNSNNPILYIERIDQDGQLIDKRGMKIEAYLEIPPLKTVGAPDEPNPHYYYHRPLSQLLGEAFVSGLILDGVEEPVFSPEQADTNRPFSRLNFPQFPAVLAARFRPVSPG